MNQVTSDWKEVVFNQLMFDSDNIVRIGDALEELLDSCYVEGNEVTPKREEVLHAFSFFEFKSLKCVVVGQDPYTDLEKAMGLAFSLRENNTIPISSIPSLNHIFREMVKNKVMQPYNPQMTNGWFGYLASQGILWLNARLLYIKSSKVKVASFRSIMNNLTEYIVCEILHGIKKYDLTVHIFTWGIDADLCLKQAKNLHDQKYDKKIATSRKLLFYKSSHPVERSKAFSCNYFNNVSGIVWDINRQVVVDIIRVRDFIVLDFKDGPFTSFTYVKKSTCSDENLEEIIKHIAKTPPIINFKDPSIRTYKDTSNLYFKYLLNKYIKYYQDK